MVNALRLMCAVAMFAPAIGATVYAGQKDAPPARKPARSAAQPFKLSAVDGIFVLRQPARAGLDLGSDAGNAEEIVVYGQSLHRIEPERGAAAPLTLGAATLSASTNTGLPGFSGMRVTAAVPIRGVAGLSAVADLSAGHDQVNSSATAASAAATVGLKLDF